MRFLFVVFFFSPSLRGEDWVEPRLDGESPHFFVSMGGTSFWQGDPYVETRGLGAHVSYRPQEFWGTSFYGYIFKSQDRPERICLENFFNDPYGVLSVSCPAAGVDPSSYLEDEQGLPQRGANFGPVYPAVTTLKNLALMEVNFSPFYGKHLTFLKIFNYFHLHLSAGLGMGQMDYQPGSLWLKDGRLSRGTLPEDVLGCPSSPGICPSDPSWPQLIGEQGRPAVESYNFPVAQLRLAQRVPIFSRSFLEGHLPALFLWHPGENRMRLFWGLGLSGGVKF